MNRNVEFDNSKWRFVVDSVRAMKNSRFHLLIAATGLLVAALSIPGCSGGGPDKAEGPIRIVTTTTMVTDLVRSIAGDRAEVVGLMGPGVDPHLYKATARNVTELQSADLIFYNGLFLEGRLGDLFSRMSRNGVKVWAVTEGIPRDQLLEPPEFEGHWDPHVWFDPQLWAQCAGLVARALAEADPDNAEYYRARGVEAEAGIRSLHDWALARIAQVPEADRVLVTSHDAFNYFGEAYGFQVIGIQGISTVSEAGLADVTRIADFVKERGIQALFVESSVSPATVERVSRDAGIRIGGELFSDAMGASGEMHTVAGETYDVGTFEGMFKHNVNTIVTALRPSRPGRGGAR